MTQEEKQLLLVDLCGRLPYGVIVQHKSREKKYNVVLSYGNISYVSQLGEGWWSECKPYLRPMSSMTEDEKKEYIEYAGYEIEESVNGRHYEYYLKDFCGTPNNPSVNADGVDWLNKKMFDYRGLIPKDLALSTIEFNPYED